MQLNSCGQQNHRHPAKSNSWISTAQVDSRRKIATKEQIERQRVVIQLVYAGLPYDNLSLECAIFLRGTSCAKSWKLLQSCICEGHDFRGALDPKTTTSWKPHCNHCCQMQSIEYWAEEAKNLTRFEHLRAFTSSIIGKGKLAGCSTSAYCSLRGTATHKATTSWILSNNCERCCCSKASRSTTWQKSTKYWIQLKSNEFFAVMMYGGRVAKQSIYVYLFSYVFLVACCVYRTRSIYVYIVVVCYCMMYNCC